MSASAATSENSMAVEPELEARRCTFDASELRWVAQGDPVALKLNRVQGSWKLGLGSEELPLSDVRSVSQLGPGFFTVQSSKLGHFGLKSDNAEATKSFVELISKRKADYERFEQYEQSSVQSYFQYYAKLVNQQNMLQDSVRTSIYRRAIIENPDDFSGHVVMDIGAGSGILSFFSGQAGAATVYAVEASSMAEVVRLLADTNNFPGTTFEVVNKPLELIQDEVKGKVDVLVSEPIGTFLFNERMIESYICARDRFLKPGGKMFPNVGNLCIAPFSDAVLHWEQANKNSFWKNNNFYGLDLNAAVDRCAKEHFRQPVVDYINPECLVSKAHVTRFDFATVTVESLHHIEIPFEFDIFQPCLIHGMAGWFDCLFEGTNATITLSTAPWCPGTHWYQIRFLLETPLAVNAGQQVEGTLVMEANNVQSYYVRLHMQIKGTSISSENSHIDLKDPEYRFYTSQNAYIPPGTPGAQPQQQNQQVQQQFDAAQATNSATNGFSVGGGLGEAWSAQSAMGAPMSYGASDSQNGHGPKLGNSKSPRGGSPNRKKMRSPQTAARM